MNKLESDKSKGLSGRARKARKLAKCLNQNKSKMTKRKKKAELQMPIAPGDKASEDQRPLQSSKIHLALRIKETGKESQRRCQWATPCRLTKPSQKVAFSLDSEPSWTRTGLQWVYCPSYQFSKLGKKGSYMEIRLMQYSAGRLSQVTIYHRYQVVLQTRATQPR